MLIALVVVVVSSGLCVLLSTPNKLIESQEDHARLGPLPPTVNREDSSAGRLFELV